MSTSAAADIREEPKLPNDATEKAISRYKDGYRKASFINGVGIVVKTLSSIAGLIFFIIYMAKTMGETQKTFGAQTQQSLEIASLGLGMATCIIVFAFGVLVSASGQKLKAVLDAAVHSSPFMDLSAKARAMSL